MLNENTNRSRNYANFILTVISSEESENDSYPIYADSTNFGTDPESFEEEALNEQQFLHT